MIHPTNIAGIPRDTEVMPSLVIYSYKQNGVIDMHIANVTSRTVVILPKYIICEIQPVTIEDHKKKIAKLNLKKRRTYLIRYISTLRMSPMINIRPLLI